MTASKRHAFLVSRADRRAARRFHSWLELRGTAAAARAEALYLDAERLCSRFADGVAAVASAADPLARFGGHDHRDDRDATDSCPACDALVARA